MAKETSGNTVLMGLSNLLFHVQMEVRWKQSVCLRPVSSSVVIGQNANIDIRAVDSVNTGSGLNILSEGQLTIRCDKQVSLQGTEVATGGKLSVKGEKVILSNGFSVKAGATLSVTNNQ